MIFKCQKPASRQDTEAENSVYGIQGNKNKEHQRGYRANHDHGVVPSPWPDLFARNIYKREIMNVIKTAIDGVLIIEPRVFEEARGYFFESLFLNI